MGSFSPEHITALTIIEKAFSRFLEDYVDLTTTQYRVLLKAYELENRGRVGEIAKALGVKSSAVSQAVDVLEDSRLLKRQRSETDRRITTLHITKVGETMVRTSDDLILENFWAGVVDNPEPFFSEVALKSLTQLWFIVGTSIGAAPSISSHTRVSSITAATVSGLMGYLNSSAHSQIGMSLTDFRVLQLACFANGGARIVDIAEELVLPPNTVTWTTDHLQEKGLVERGDVDNDLRAVRIMPSAKGADLAAHMQSTLDGFLADTVWPNMNEAEIEATYVGAREVISLARSRRVNAEIQADEA